MSKAERDARYNASAKGRARHATYNRSEKARERWQRYDHSEKGRARDKRRRPTPAFLAQRLRYNKRRIFIGHDCVDVAATPELAERINAHIKERRLEFVTRQSARAQAEGASAGAVPAETEL